MNKYLFLLVFWGSTLACFGQLPAFRLTKTIGTPVLFPEDVAVDRAGFMYLLDGGGVTKLAPSGEVAQSITLEQYVSGGFGLGVDGAGNLYVCNYTYGSVGKYDPTGKLLLQIGAAGSGPGQFREMNSLAVDAAGNVYVADTGNNRVQKFDTNGRLLFEYGATGAARLNRPMDVAVDAGGSVYVFDNSFNVTKLSAAGVLLQTIPLEAAQVYYDEATAIAVGPAGDFYVTTFRGRSIQKFTKDGVRVNTGSAYNFFDGTHTPLALDAAGNLYATNRDHHGNSKLFKFDPSGQVLNKWGNLNTFYPLAQDEAGNYYYFDQRLGKVCKYNAAHQLLAQFAGYGSADGQFSASDNVFALTLDEAGNLYALTAGFTKSSILKLGPDGRFLARYTDFGGNITYSSSGIGLAVDAAGSMYVTDYYGGCVRRIGPQGQVLPAIGTWGTGAGQLWLPQAVAVDARGFVYVADNVGRRVQRFTPGGQLVREFGARTTMNTSVPVCTVSLAVDESGNMYVNSLDAGTQVFDPGGRGQTLLPLKGVINRRATRLISVSGDVLRFYAADNVHRENLLTGTVFDDRDGNCVRDAVEPGLPGIAVVAQPGDYYGLSDENGNYVIAVDTGAYTVRQVLPTQEVGRTIAPACTPAAPPLSFVSYGSTLRGPDFGNSVSTAPYLSVSVGANRRRRCARGVTTVAYANTGFAPARGAQVVVALPPYVVLVDADAAYTRDAQGRYVFAVGDVAPYQRGRITIQDSVVCGNTAIRGLTLCTKAWITPANTYPEPAQWNKASMDIRSALEPNGQVRFALRNRGRGPTTDSLTFRVYQDAQLALTHRYALAAGDSLVLRIPATRPVVRLEADQPAGHPLQARTSATVEVPAQRTSTAPSAAMTALPPDATGPETAEDCQPVVDSFDPNYKQVFPTGTTAQHYTPTQGALHYQVRFQNTGTDDAYYVTVIDTLSADLDLSTLRLGAASHPYRLTVSGKQRPVLTVTFGGLALPPSTRDAAGSQGYVQFSICPKPGRAPQARVENYADIVFDYNAPVRTNTTVNRLYDAPDQVAPPLAYEAVAASPSVDGFAPAEGRAGTLVTVRGQRFAGTPALNRVAFNGVAAPVLSATATALTVRVPAGATPGKIQVATPDGAARSRADFAAFLPPTLAAVAPNEGVPGATVTLTGTGFSPDNRLDSVAFNGVAAVVRSASATELAVEVPAGALLGPVSVRAPGGRAESTQPFRVWYPPAIAGFAPGKGRAGTVLTITGTNFAETAARNVVAVGAAPAQVVQASATELRVLVPAAAQSGALVVHTPGGQAVAAANFIFVPAPVIAGFEPREGSVGTVLTVTGRYFNADNQPDTLYVNGVAAPVLSTSATQATIRVPRGVHTGPVSVAGAGGRARSGSNFLVLDLTPAEALAVYPNPTRGQVTVDWQRADFLVQEISIYDALGRLVAHEDVGSAASPTATFSLANSGRGLYLAVIRTARGPVVKRIAVF
ncbi:DUF7619 domain-containing protein [Hymenobacter sp. PAMC 26628]|uniref:DUF7619 domain-containing protein n=1 Tax=Hymenobacter sp. PAMC 26628 TaxID=1484118 RepID=UPI0007701340|nr:IPT/TIG domain-containing protein [Hymenobacter sp. PAMC 26628]AMJ66607.1 hypothetical protein AXW84_15115 [Hymenobacter sp. PAMC 26628]